MNRSVWGPCVWLWFIEFLLWLIGLLLFHSTLSIITLQGPALGCTYPHPHQAHMTCFLSFCHNYTAYSYSFSSPLDFPPCNCQLMVSPEHQLCPTWRCEVHSDRASIQTKPMKNYSSRYSDDRTCVKHSYFGKLCTIPHGSVDILLCSS